MVKDVYADIIENMRPGVTEIMCHPASRSDGTVDHNFGPYFLARTRQDEFEALLDKTLLEELQRRNIKLVHFGDIQP
jgi:hypothetical protein